MKEMTPWNKGKKLSKKHKENISKAMQGNQYALGHTLTPETKLKISKKLKGNVPWNKGKTNCYSKEILKEMSEKKKGNQIRKGEKLTKETKEKISKNRIGKAVMEKHYNWRGGKSFEPYGIEFNEKLKEQIRKRDCYRCQECSRQQIELERKLDVHHIDFDKANNNPNNLIALCNSCHSQTNYGRENWIEYYQNRILENRGDIKWEN